MTSFDSLILLSIFKRESGKQCCHRLITHGGKKVKLIRKLLVNYNINSYRLLIRSHLMIFIGRKDNVFIFHFIVIFYFLIVFHFILTKLFILFLFLFYLIKVNQLIINEVLKNIQILCRHLEKITLQNVSNYIIFCYWVFICYSLNGASSICYKIALSYISLKCTFLILLILRC